MAESQIFKQFENTIPPGHECPGPEECTLPKGMYALVLQNPEEPDDPTAYITSLYIHLLGPGELVSAVVDFVDSAFQDNRADGIPAMIAHAKARDLLRAAVEQAPPPPAVAEELFSFVEDSAEDWKGLL